MGNIFSTGARGNDNDMEMDFVGRAGDEHIIRNADAAETPVTATAVECPSARVWEFLLGLGFIGLGIGSLASAKVFQDSVGGDNAAINALPYWTGGLGLATGITLTGHAMLSTELALDFRRLRRNALPTPPAV